MSSGLFARSADLRRLVDQGFELAERAGHLVVSNIPYVASDGTIARGALVAKLLEQGGQTQKPQNHVVRWIGGHPCDRFGKPLPALVNSARQKVLAPDLTIDLTFSSRPDTPDANYFDIFTRYVDMIEGPAQAADPTVSARTFRVAQPPEENSVFLYRDTASSRAGIAAVVARVAGQRIGIVGLGGTGCYILDFVAKCPVAEIHLFDGDVFGQHNAFRAPGAADEVTFGENKATHWASVYGKMHRGVIAHPAFADESNIDQLIGLDFAFLSMDPGPGKRAVVEQLGAQGIAFIDVGMGIAEEEGKLGGILQVTLSTADKPAAVSVAEGAAGDYDENVQIAELNALNAALAVIRWKKHFGFYRDLGSEIESTYSLDTNDLINTPAA